MRNRRLEIGTLNRLSKNGGERDLYLWRKVSLCVIDSITKSENGCLIDYLVIGLKLSNHFCHLMK